MFITRATRHDETDRQAFFEALDDWNPYKGKAVSFVARDGGIVGNVSLIELDPQILVVEDVVVAESHRGKGMGRQLLQAAMNSRGGKLYLVCHDDVLDFYARFGFSEMPFDELPEQVKRFFIEDEAAPHQLREGHVHYFLVAR
jgi:N-acetylglutamate synthase-like GNAT family acetyltransferase